MQTYSIDDMDAVGVENRIAQYWYLLSMRQPISATMDERGAPGDNATPIVESPIR